jgi:diguanylate cyclase (GGDEF)-like protein
MANNPSQSAPIGGGTYREHPGLREPLRVLELSRVLQTTLDLGELLELLTQELQPYLEFDGLSYRNPEQELQISKGRSGRHSLSYSLTVTGQMLGDLTVFRHYPFHDEEIRTLEDLLVALLYPLRNTLQYRRAVLSALVDPLTGVNNRAAMDMVLKREVELARRQGTNLSVILLDVDHFKRVNDTHGHSAGDTCLQAVAQTVKDSIRSSDLVFRCGGEEFLVLLSQTDREGAVLLAERIRGRIKALRLSAIMEQSISVSLGVTAVVERDTVSTLFDRADAALYRAKNGGRNRSEVL